MGDATHRSSKHLLVIEEDFNCEKGDHEPGTWTKTKRLWCCESRGVGCPYDCKVGLADFNVWTKNKKQWCCENKGLGCPWSASVPFNCQVDYNDWQHKWKKEKADWCCLHKALGCIFPSTSTLTTTALVAAEGTVTSADQHRQQDTKKKVPNIVFKIPKDVHGESGNAPNQAPSKAGTGSNGHAKDCFEDATSWEPLDMPGTYPVLVDGVKACQRKCAETPGCVHFSYWQELHHCHLQDAYAFRLRGRTGFVSGPFKCWEDLHGDGWVRKDPFTFVRKELACMDLGTLYSPLMGVVRFFPKMTEIEAIRKCRDYCASHEGCVHFSLQFPAHGCRMAGSGARKLQPFLNAVSGNWTCWDGKDHGKEAKSPEALSLLRRDASLPISSLGASGAEPSIVHVALAAGGIALGFFTAATAVLLRRRRRPAPCNITDSERSMNYMASSFSVGYNVVREDSEAQPCSGSAAWPSL
mmetsp:Transcript_104364/g.202155  ORF Transcript_104364/g.202155 Transcript_104364/m.202155 type:complete len:468 (+) Transcript_104364:38-1441(+)